MKRIVWAGFIGGVVAFVWSSILHLNPWTAPMGLSTLDAKEDAVASVLRGQDVAPGLYFFPGKDMSKKMTPAEEEAWNAKFKAGPSGLLSIEPKGEDPMTPRQLAIEFVSTVLCGIIAATLLATTVGPLISRAVSVSMVGLFGWLAISVSQWDWYHFPFAFVALDLMDQVIGWFLAGLVMARMVKPANCSAAPASAAAS